MAAPELFDEADYLVCVGNCFHGQRNATSGALTSPSGVGLALGDRIPGAPADGWNRVSKFSGLPAVTSSPDDIAAGRTWLDYAIWVGRQRYYMPYYAVGQGPVQVGPLKWPYRTGDGTVWWLDVYFTSDYAFSIYARKAAGLLVEFGPGPGATLIGSYSGSNSFLTQRWTNFAHDGSKAAIHGGLLDGSDELAAAIIVDVTISGGTSSAPPSCTTVVAFQGDDLAMKWSNNATWLQYKAVLSTDQLMHNGQWGNYYHTTYSVIVSDQAGNGTFVGDYVGNRVLAVVFSGNTRHVLRYEEAQTSAMTDQLDASGSRDEGSVLFRDDSYWRLRRVSSNKVSRRLKLDGTVIVELVLQEQVAVSDTQRVGIGAVWPDHSHGETPVETVLESSNVLTTWYVGSAVNVALVNGECGVFKYQRPADNKQVIAAYCNSRHSAQFPEATAPIMEDFATFSTHPLSGVFDPQFDLYF